MTDRSDRVLLRYEIDEAALNRTIARAQAARQRIADIRGTLAQINQAARPTGDALRSVFDSAERSASKLSQRLDEVNRKRLRGTLPSQQMGLDELRGSLTGGAAGGGRAGTALGLIGPGFSTLRGLQQGNIGQAALGGARLVPELTQLVGGVGKLAAIAPVAAVAIGGMALAFDQFNKTIGASAQSLVSASKQLDAFYEAAEKNTTESTRKQIADLENHKEFVDTNLEVRVNAEKKAFESAQRVIGGNVTFIGDAFARLGFALAQTNPEIKGVLDRTQELKAESIGLGSTMAGLNAAINAGITATNDAAEAEKNLAESRLQAFQASLEQRKRLAATTSQEQVDEQRSTLQGQINVNENYLKSIPLVTLNTKELIDAYNKLAEDTKKLKADLEALDSVLASTFSRDDITDDLERSNELEETLIDTRQRETEWILKSTEAMNDFTDEMERLSEERKIAASREGQDFSIKRARDQAEFTRKQAESDSAYYKDRGKKIAAFNREMADSDNEAQKARAKAVQEANDAQIRAAEDFARTVRDFTEQITDAGANLDAIGVRNAQRGLANANDQYNLEKRRRDQDAKARIDEIAENAKEQKDARAAAFAEELTDADAEYATERQKSQEEFARRLQQEDQDRALRLQRQAEDYARQDAQRRAAFDKQINNLQNQLLYPEEQAKVASYSRQRSSLNDFLNGAVNDINSAKTRTGASDASRSSTMTRAENNSSFMTVAASNSSTMTRAQPRIATTSAFSRGFAHGGRPPIGVPVMINEGRAEPVIFGSPAQIGGSAWGKGGSGVNIGDIYLNGGLAPEQYKSMVRQGIAEAFSEAMN